VEHHDIERRLDRLEVQVETGFSGVREDIKGIADAITPVVVRLAIVETKQAEREAASLRLKRWAAGVLATLASSGLIFAAVKIAGL
jgi:hypothetical protein